jgi:S-(hydroxymethyl)glutathione dehydrogenase/alcohol dehydrogenase
MNPTRLKITHEFGTTDLVLATEEQPWQLATQAKGHGNDAVFVTGGNARIYDSAKCYLALSCQIVLIGMPTTGALSAYDSGTVASISQSIVGSKMGNVLIQRDIHWIVDLYK